MADLSILIPARNEIWLKNTVEDILKNIEADTEILVAMDGQWSKPGLNQDPRVTIVYFPSSIGQRASTNRLCALSNAKYVMKVDAHCAFDKGFDRIMIEDMQDHYTMAPAMKNLHVFQWVCECGHDKYQGPTIPCPLCGKNMKKEIRWFAKPSPLSTSYRVNSQLEFKYFGEYKAKQIGDIVDTMSLQGSCFMMTRKKYHELNICDESWGSWGGQGAEVALKTWLSGGEVKVNKKTWYAHLFRTQGKDFGFPYPNPGNEQKKAKDTLRKIFLNDDWSQAVRSLSWLVRKFWPVPDWTKDDLRKIESNKIMKSKPIKYTIHKGIIFYTDNKLKLSIAHSVQKQLNKIGLPIVNVSLKPMKHFGENICLYWYKRGRIAYLKQILTALETSAAEIVYFCEHDVLYHPSHFEFTPKERDRFYFNINVWKWNSEKSYGVKVDDCKQISGMCCYRELALNFYIKKFRQVKTGKFDGHYEPQVNRESFSSTYPNVDIRHANNFTCNRWTPDEFKNKKYTKGWVESTEIPGWKGALNGITR